jgi:flagellar protein FlaG
MSQIASTTASAPQSAAAPRATSASVQDLRGVVPTKVQSKGNTAAATSAAPTSAKAMSEDIQRASADLQRRVNILAPELQFSVDETSGRSIIKFTDRATNEVIRQFPSEEALALTRAMDQFQRGLIFNRKA